MRHRTPIALVALIALALVLTAQPGPVSASHNATRTFVSTTGSDTNPCSAAAPCRSFAVAIGHTAAGGEVLAVDSGGYGPVTITKSVAIIGAPGAHVAITASTGNAVSINAGATDKVILRNLYLNSQGAAIGINWQSGALLQVDHLVVSGFSDTGILHVASGGVLIATDVVTRNNFFHGVVLFSQVGTLVRATLDHVQAEGNGSVGIFVLARTTGSTARLEVSDCVATRNGSGIQAEAEGAVAEANVERCQASHNGTGMSTVLSFGGTGTLRVSNSVITFNELGVTGAGTLSRGNNTLEGNTTDGTFTGSITAK